MGQEHLIELTQFLSSRENQLRHDVADEVQEIPAKRKCRRSLPTDFVAREIPNYYGGKHMGPGELTYVKDLTIASSYKDKAYTQRELYLIWIEIRKFKGAVGSADNQ